MLNTEHIVYTQSMATSAPLKNTVSTEEWLSATTFVKQRNTAFRNNYCGSQPFLMSCYLTKILDFCDGLPVNCSSMLF